MLSNTDHLFVTPSNSENRKFSKQQPPSRKAVDEDSDSVNLETIKVYLRIKPSKYEELAKTLEIIDDRYLSIRPPADSSALKKRLGKQEECRFMFTHIFGPDVKQQQLFEKCVEVPVADFLGGLNSLIFSYGTSNGGKTFTVQGTKNHPGLIPRALHLVFNSINDHQADELNYMPYMNGVMCMTDQDKKELDELKQKLTESHCDEELDPDKTFIPEIEKAFQQMEEHLDNEMRCLKMPLSGKKFSLWISYIEIYNEVLYDLLKPLPLNRQRKPLKLAEDNTKTCYIKDLSYINVTTAGDAYKVMMFGKNNLHFASTGANKRSSRSHCIFMMTLVHTLVDQQSDCSVTVSRLSICDLAGSERQKNTQNVGNRLKESLHINCSMHVLNKCFDRIRENQNRTDKLVIPYRESKLTKLFQKPLSGEGKVTMVVNVNPEVSFEETQQVLKTSAIARKIVVLHEKTPRPVRKRPRSMLFSASLAEHSKKNASKHTSASLYANDCQTIEELDEPTTITIHESAPENVSNDRQLIESLLETIDVQKNEMSKLQDKIEELEGNNRDSDMELKMDVKIQHSKVKNTMDCQLKTSVSNHMTNKKQTESWKDNDERPVKKQKMMDSARSVPSSSACTKTANLIEKEKVLMNEIKSLKSVLDQYKDQHKKMTAEISELKMKKVEEAANNEKDTIEEIEQIKKVLQKSINDKSDLLYEAFEEIEGYEKEISDLKIQIRKLEEKLILKETKLDELEKQMLINDEMLLEKTDKNEELESKVESLQKDVDNLLDYVEIKDEEMKGVNDKLQAGHDRMVELEEKCTKLEEQLIAEKSKCEDLTLQFVQLSKTNESQAFELLKLQDLDHDKVQAVGAKTVKLEEKCTKLKEQLLAEKSKCEDITLQFEQLSKVNESKTFEILKLKDLCKTMELDSRNNENRFKDIVDSKDKEIRNVTDQLKEIEKQFNSIVDSKDAETRDLSVQLKEIEKQFKSRIDSKEKEICDLSAQLKESKKQFNTMVDSKDAEIRDLSVQLKEIENQFKSRIDSKEKEISDLSVQLKESEKKFNSMVDSKDAEIRDLSVQLKEIDKQFKSRIDSKEKEIRDLSVLLEERKGRNEMLKSASDELQRRYTALERKIGEDLHLKNEQLEKTSKIIAECYKEKELLEKECANLRAYAADLETTKNVECRRSSRKMEELLIEKKKLEDSLHELSEKYEKQHSCLKTEIKNGNLKVVELEKCIVLLKKENEVLKTELTKLKEDTCNKEKELKEEKRKIDNFKKNNEMLRTELIRCEEKFIEYEKRLETLHTRDERSETSQLAMYKNENQHLKGEISKYESKCSKMKKNLEESLDRFINSERLLSKKIEEKEQEVRILKEHHSIENEALKKEIKKIEKKFAEYKATIEEHVSKEKNNAVIKKQMAAYQKEMLKFSKDTDKFEEKVLEIENLKKNIDKKEKELKEATNCLSKHLEENQNLKTEISQMKAKFDQYERNMEQDISKDKQIKELTTRVNQYKDENTELKDQLISYNRKFVELEEKLDENLGLNQNRESRKLKKESDTGDRRKASPLAVVNRSVEKRTSFKTIKKKEF